jgi:hypothetical protein
LLVNLPLSRLGTFLQIALVLWTRVLKHSAHQICSISVGVIGLFPVVEFLFFLKIEGYNDA